MSLKAVLAFITTAAALTITSPTSSSIDPTQPLTVTWTSSASDPPTFDLVLDQSGSLSVFSNLPLGSNIETSAGSYTIPANTAQAYGDQFVIEAVSNGAVLGQTGSFTLSGSASDVPQGVTGSMGVVASATSMVGSATSAVGSATVAAMTSGAVSPAAVSAMTSSGSMTTSTRSASGTSTTSTSSASATSSTNAQARLEMGAGQIVMSLAGALAGIAALCA